MKSALKFLPLLLIYFLYVLVTSKPVLESDEIRYYMFAQNIVDGAYTDPANPNLINGPGYPLFLAPFVALDLPYIVPRLFNGVFCFLAIILFYKSLLFFNSRKTSFVLAYFLGLYLPMYKWIRLNFSEIISLFLICVFLYFTLKMMRSVKIKVKEMLIAGVALGYLILIKVIFGYVVLASLAVSGIFYVVSKTKKSLIFASVLTIGFLVSVPFLIYTYSLTGRVFYWGSNGGEQLYWMSTHYENEWGSWVAEQWVLDDSIRYPEMHPSHVEVYKYARSKPWVEANDFLMEKGIENIKARPQDYAYNVIANAMRLISDAPMSFYKQSIRPYFFLFFNMIFLAPLVFSLYPAWLNRRYIPFDIISFTLFLIFYLGASVLLCAVHRYFIIVVPLILFWVAFIFTNYVQITFENKPFRPQ